MLLVTGCWVLDKLFFFSIPSIPFNPSIPFFPFLMQKYKFYPLFSPLSSIDYIMSNREILYNIVILKYSS